jgi:hypothetical protein
MRKYLGACLLILFILLVGVSIIFSHTILQEGNPLLVADKMGTILITGSSYEKLDENRYIVRSTPHDKKRLITYLAKHNLTLTDQMGAGLLFKAKQGESFTAIVRMDTAFFEIWDFHKQSKNDASLP